MAGTAPRQGQTGIDEKTVGWRRLLSHPLVYETVQYLVGAKRGLRILLERHIRPVAGQSILDIGCGPAEIVKFLPDVRYCGVDHSASYIDRARRAFGDRATFHLGDVGDLPLDRLGHFDIAIAIGVLHHINDQTAQDMLRAARDALAPNGRLVTADPCYFPGQNPLTRFIISKDRGQHVRAIDAYLDLVRRVFPDAQRHHIRGLLPFPHSVCVIEASRDG
ncbi:class I SAM-dependent methyltransferase [Dongia sedimenti]|uniref:Class I SAM-dependent methyltransferase n=1 Tax=Dongia sedimenti TaxID=3064282 RepID=A0ABU0YKW4_9PROT|nr:class I SAM-dependent methyltransferase [Rhodospirillaceae bacterium R-7]